MKITIFGIELTARKAPAKRRRPDPVEPQPALARFRDPLKTCFSSVSDDFLSPPSAQPVRLPGEVRSERLAKRLEEFCSSAGIEPRACSPLNMSIQPLARVTRIY